VYNFLPYGEKILGFVEAGWKPTPRCINITKLGASKTAQSVSSVTVVWVARHISRTQTVVVGWYKNATVFNVRQVAPLNSNRMLPNGAVAEYFVEADKCDCARVPPGSRNITVPRGVKGGLGQKNIWYLSGSLGKGSETRLIAYIAANHSTFVV